MIFAIIIVMRNFCLLIITVYCVFFTNISGASVQVREDLSKIKTDVVTQLGPIFDVYGKTIEISIVSYQMAENIFNMLKNKPYITFDYPEDGCYARAHIMSRILETKGIISGKAFIHGNLGVTTSNSPKGYVRWRRYHVAPFIFVKEHNFPKVYVLDPSIFDRPVPLKKWQKIQTNSIDNTSANKSYLTSRFHFLPIYTPSLMDLYRQYTFFKRRDIDEYKVSDFMRITGDFEEFRNIKKEQELLKTLNLLFLQEK